LSKFVGTNFKCAVKFAEQSITRESSKLFGSAGN
jgi:hypothetical protein